MDNMEFTIIDGILIKYNGSGGDVVVPEGVWKIDRLVFDSKNITSVSLPAGLRVIEGLAFSDCRSLEAVDFPESLERIENYTFSGCRSLKSVVLPKGLISLGDGAFMDCESLSSARLPDRIDTIGFALFADCFSLSEISIPETVKTIKRSAFKGCKSLQKVCLPKGLECIEIDGFAGCKSLEEIFIPDSVTVIENSAFKGCSNLCQVHLPANLRELGPQAFEMCNNVGGSLADENGMLCVGSMLYRYFGNDTVVTVPEGIKTIGWYAFADNRAVIEIRLPSTLDTIRNYAFSRCTSLKAIEIPEGVLSIGSGAFSGCNNLQQITLPGSVSSVGKYILDGCNCEVFLHHWSPLFSEELHGKWIEHIHVEDFASAPPKYKLPFALNFIRESNHDLSSPRSKAHLKYLAANSGKLVEPALRHKELLAFLCENRLIKGKDIDLFVEKAHAWDDSEAYALLKDYKAKLDE